MKNDFFTFVLGMTPATSEVIIVNKSWEHAIYIAYVFYKECIIFRAVDKGQ